MERKALVKPAKKIKPPLWYKGEKFDYLNQLKTRGKIVGHFRVDCGRRQGLREVVKFMRVFENGMAICIDTTMWKIGVTQSVGTPFKLRPSNKREFDKALKLFLQNII